MPGGLLACAALRPVLFNPAVDWGPVAPMGGSVRSLVVPPTGDDGLEARVDGSVELPDVDMLFAFSLDDRDEFGGACGLPDLIGNQTRFGSSTRRGMQDFLARAGHFRDW